MQILIISNYYFFYLSLEIKFKKPDCTNEIVTDCSTNNPPIQFTKVHQKRLAAARKKPITPTTTQNGTVMKNAESEIPSVVRALYLGIIPHTAPRNNGRPTKLNRTT